MQVLIYSVYVIIIIQTLGHHNFLALFNQSFNWELIGAKSVFTITEGKDECQWKAKSETLLNLNPAFLI